MKIFEIRFGAHRAHVVVKKGGVSSIATNFKDNADENDDFFIAAVDGLESLILAHAVAGINVEAPNYVEGVKYALTSIATET